MNEVYEPQSMPEYDYDEVPYLTAKIMGGLTIVMAFVSEGLARSGQEAWAGTAHNVATYCAIGMAVGTLAGFGRRRIS